MQNSTATISLRAWQQTALQAWATGGRRGIASVVTGGGKTLFALSCIADSPSATALIVVPTTALLDQWWEAASQFLGLSLDDIQILNGRSRMRYGTVNIGVLNTVAKLADRGTAIPSLLVVDECHRAASGEFRKIFELPTTGTLGLSATPARQYDAGLEDILVPALGPVFFEYSYKDAMRDGVIVPFVLRNVAFDLEPERALEYGRLTNSIARSMSEFGIEAERTVKLLLRRAKVSNGSDERIRLAARIAVSLLGKKIVIFHEDIDACQTIFKVLSEYGASAYLYHSKLPARDRVTALQMFRAEHGGVLIACRALDEGIDVPGAEIAIVAASTATRRQRVQRLGRVLRPSSGKSFATVYTLAGTTLELDRLKAEAKDLSEIAKIEWIDGRS